MEPQAKLALEKIAGELENDQLAQAAVLLAEAHPADAADILMALEEPQRVPLAGGLGLSETKAVLEYLDSEDAVQLTVSLDPMAATAVLDESAPDIAADVLGQMEAQAAAEILGLMRKAQRVAPLLLHPVS